MHDGDQVLRMSRCSRWEKTGSPGAWACVGVVATKPAGACFSACVGKGHAAAMLRTNSLQVFTNLCMSSIFVIAFITRVSHSRGIMQTRNAHHTNIYLARTGAKSDLCRLLLLKKSPNLRRTDFLFLCFMACSKPPYCLPSSKWSNS